MGREVRNFRNYTTLAIEVAKMNIKARKLTELDNAVKSHESQMWIGKFMVFGVKMEVPENEIGVGDRNCGFGRWLAMNYDWLVQFYGEELIEGIEVLHRHWHIENAKIVELYRKGEKSGVIGRFMKSKSIGRGDIDKAKAYFVEAEKLSERLLENMTKLRIRIEATALYRLEEYFG
jgi:hypothetical protein